MGIELYIFDNIGHARLNGFTYKDGTHDKIPNARCYIVGSGFPDCIRGLELSRVYVTDATKQRAYVDEEFGKKYDELLKFVRPMLRIPPMTWMEL